ncbi:hypothetical protein ACFE33_09970 [Falsihalocynthiibacter sp. SS001]|uniref:hypothetical protein n=1 Tax=Falsihalocynthiibacter sp. SS001 TaxID=3349698 RepID=UPI0036D380DC
MKTTAHSFFVTASLLIILGMLMGIYMSASGNFAIAPAHGHLMLFGFVALTIFGTYYKLWPMAGATRLARIHLWVSIVALIVFVPGIALANLEISDVYAKLGSVLVLISALMFAWSVLRNSAAE